MTRVSEPLWRSRREACFYLLPVGCILAFYAVVMVVGPEHPADEGGLVDLVVGLVLALALVYRRRYPLTIMLAVLAASVVMFLSVQLPQLDWLSYVRPEDPWVPLAAPVATYNTALYRNNILGWSLIASLTVLACRPWEPSTDVITGGILLVAVPALLGLYVGAHRRLVQALTDRAERAEREQHLLAERARAEERVRLAEEMHDVVTHRVSLMVLHAGALGVTAPDQHTREAAEGLRAAGCQALNELRDLVGVLRNGETDTGEASRAGSPDNQGNPDEAGSVPDLSTLVAESESVGVPVELREDGNPARTSPTVGRTAYRIVQESLTNIRKHAPGSRASVHVRYGGDRVRLTIRNTAPNGTGDSGLSGTGSGTGLLGLRQRVELVGGTLTAGPRPGGGFEVDAILPAYVPAG